MEGVGVCASIAMAMMAEGTEQVVQVDHRTILKKVMEAIGSPEEPVYATYGPPSDGYRVSVKLNVATAKNYAGQKIDSVEIDGDTLPSKLGGEKSAVINALRYLKKKHFIKIYDFSSKVARELNGSSAFQNVNAGVYSVDRVLAKWAVVIDKFKEVVVQLAGRENAARSTEHGAFQCNVYRSLHDGIETMVDIYKPRLTEATSKTADVELARKKYHNASTQKYHADLVEAHLQNIFLTAKDILGYVLTYIGAGKPSYTNWPNEGTMTEGVAQFNIPEVKGLEFNGNINIKGKSTGSRESEENAAYNALVYMEKTYKLRIVDLNHEDRINAEKDQKMLVHLIEELARVGTDVKKYWREMIETINSEKTGFMGAAANMSDGAAGENTNEAYNYCITCLQELEEETKNGYNDCAFRFEEITKLLYSLEDLKAMMDIE